jgi:hypothetical protein
MIRQVRSNVTLLPACYCSYAHNWQRKALLFRGTQAGECANARHRMLDLGRQSCGATRKTAGVLASRCVSNTRRSRSRQGVAWHSNRIVWQSVVDEHRGRQLESTHGNRIAEIGPLPVVAGEKYSAQFMEADFTPGMTAPAHIHSGPEAWYAVGGETCLETSDGRMQISRAGGPP